MQSILEHYLHPENLGLLLLDMPTGSGKTYSIIEYIATHIDTLHLNNRKIIFITPLKKNLPIEDLKQRLHAYGKDEYFEQEVLFVQSTKDAFIAHFRDCEHDIARLFPSYDCFSVKEAIKGLDNLTLKQVLEPIISKKGSELGRLVSSTLRNKYPITADRIQLIKTDPKWRWVSKLFPAVLTQERSVLFMSLAKFVYPYQTLVQPLMPFSELLAEYHVTLFIDEVDASKQVLQSYIIEQGLSNTLELVPTVRQIASRLRESKLPANLLPPHKLSKQPVTPNEIEDNFREKTQDIVKTFKTELSLKSREDNNHHSFIFYDKDTHYLADANDKIVTVEPDYKHSTLWIDFEKKDKTKKGQRTTLGQLLSQHRAFIEWFKGGLAMLANNYYYQRRARVGISFEDAARSYLDFFHLPEASVRQLINEIQYKRLSKAWLPITSASLAEQSSATRFYEHGFIYHSISNSESHAGRSKVLSFNFPCAAELILLSWCRQFMVVGVSATANIKSRLGNYDLHYLQSSLNSNTDKSDKFYTLTDKQKQVLQAQFNASKSGYSQVDIQTHWHGLADGLSELEVVSRLSELFGVGEDYGADPDDITDLRLQISSLYSEQQYLYRLSQYYKIFELWCAHLTQQTVAFLLLLGKGYRDQELDLIHDFCDLLSRYHQCSDRYATEEIVSIVGDNSMQTITQVKSDLAKGKRRFVLSTYATLGAGINIQFPIPANHPKDLLKINLFKADSHTDFDALYLDKPTNVLVNTNSKQPIAAKDLIRHIYQLEYLKISGLTYGDFHSYLQKAFLAYIGRTNYHYSQENIYQSVDYRLHVMQILIQAVGRICRTNMKSPTIHLHLDRGIAQYWYDDLDDMPLLPEFQQISAAVNNYQQTDNVLAKAVLAKDMVKVREAIYRMLARFRDGGVDEAIVAQWQLIRDICLKHPQYNDSLDKKYQFFYTNFAEPKSAYYYRQEYDYRDVEILSDKQPYAYEVSEASAKLDVLMRHPGLKSHFISRGYATTLSASKHWLQPILFNNIYKGALGEVCGAYLWEKYELPYLYDMPQEQFEVFDFKVNDTVFVDFKHWAVSQQDGEKVRQDIFKKMKAINAKLVFIINIIADSDHLDYRVFNGRHYNANSDQQIVEIPAFILTGVSLINLIEFINNTISECSP